jgi:hypothetical protein
VSYKRGAITVRLRRRRNHRNLIATIRSMPAPDAARSDQGCGSYAYGAHGLLILMTAISGHFDGRRTMGSATAGRFGSATVSPQYAFGCTDTRRSGSSIDTNRLVRYDITFHPGIYENHRDETVLQLRKFHVHGAPECCNRV